ncbi:ribonuclease H-like domain-containing protein [Tanacetum coccineum]
MTGNKAYLAEFQDFNGGPVAFGGSKGYITGKGKIKTGKLDFEDVCFVKELQHFNLFSVSQMCDKKNKVLFTDSECLVLSPEFKLPDENQVLLKIPRQNNMYSFNLENIVPSGGLACLIAKATTDESNKWHRRLGHVNFKNLNKLMKGNLVRGLPSKIFQYDPLCVACQKGKQHKASCKAKSVSSISHSLQLLHMDLFGPTSNLRTRMLLNSVGLKGSRGNTVMPELHNKMELLRERTGTLMRNLGPCWPDHFYLTLFGLKQLVLLVISENQANLHAGQQEANHNAGTEDIINAGDYEKEDEFAQDCFVLPIWPSYSSTIPPDLKTDEKRAVADFTNLETVVNVSPIPHQDYLVYRSLILGDPTSAVQTRSKVNNSSGAHAFVSYVQKQRRNNHKDFQHCLFACFLSQNEPKKISEALEDENLPYGKKAIGTKWVYRNKKDERGVVVRNKARLVAQGHRQEVGDKTMMRFCSVARKSKRVRSSLWATSSSQSLMSSMGELTFFLGLQVKQKEDGIFISQDKSMIGSLMYLTASRPDIMFADYPHRAQKNKGIIDSGCSRHMTGNKAYLAEFQDFNGGPVAFGGSKGYITGKGTKDIIDAGDSYCY